MSEEEAVEGEDEASGVAEQRRIAELGQPYPRIPCGEVERVEDCRCVDDRDQRAAWPVRSLAGDARNQPQERQCEKQSPEADGNRPHVRQPHEPRPESERDVAD
jgi:hypothetical protein